MAVLVTNKVRFSFVNAFTPRVGQDGGEAKYSVTMLLPKSDIVGFKALQDTIASALQDGVRGKFGGQMPARPATPIHDGDALRPNGEPFGDECKGHWVFTASSKVAPTVVDANVQPIINPSMFYSGCYGRADINFFAYNTAGKKGVGCGLCNLQKLEDGESLGGTRSATQAFGAPTATPTFNFVQTVDPLTGMPTNWTGM